MSTENEKNPIVNGKELKDEAVEQVTGGALGFNPDDNGTYAMTCKYSGRTYTGVSLNAAISNAATAVDATAAAAADATTAPAVDAAVAKPDSVSNGECVVTFPNGL